MSDQFIVRYDYAMIIKGKGNKAMWALPLHVEESHEISHSNTAGTSQDSKQETFRL
jgi:hypothetical protein